MIGVHTARGRIPYVNYDNPGFQFTISSAPMARDIRDAAIAMKVIAGPDGRDPASLEDDVPDYVGALKQGAQGMRFAWTDDFGFASMYALPPSRRWQRFRCRASCAGAIGIAS